MTDEIIEGVTKHGFYEILAVGVINSPGFRNTAEATNQQLIDAWCEKIGLAYDVFERGTGKKAQQYIRFYRRR